MNDATRREVEHARADEHGREARALLPAFAESLATHIPGVGVFAEAALRAHEARRLERIEDAVAQVQAVLQDRAAGLGSPKDFDAESLATVLETWFEAVVGEAREEKRRLLAYYLSNTFVEPVTRQNLDVRLAMLRALEELSPLQSRIVALLLEHRGQNYAVSGEELELDADLDALVEGETRRLFVMGLATGDYIPTSRNDRQLAMAEITPYGEAFCDFCLRPPPPSGTAAR